MKGNKLTTALLITVISLGLTASLISGVLAQPAAAPDRALVTFKAWLPVVRVIYPPLPEKAVLKPIDNSDRDDNYRVEWWPALRASSYVLEVDNNPQFSSPDTAYQGSSTSQQFDSLSSGTRYYRVRGVNSYGAGPWSAPVSVNVPAPWGIWVIQNDTGGSLTLELYGFGTASYPPGRHEWEVPAGTQRFKASARCGTLEDTIDIPRYGRTEVHRFWCESYAGEAVLTN